MTDSQVDETTPAAVEPPKPRTFKERVADGLLAQFPTLCRLAQELQNPNSTKHYNPTHPGTWDRICANVNPAGELKRLALAFAIDFPDEMKEWNVVDEWKDYNSDLIHSVERRAARVGTSLLQLGNRHELRGFIANRCQHILGFDIQYVPLQKLNREHEVVVEDDRIETLLEDALTN